MQAHCETAAHLSAIAGICQRNSTSLTPRGILQWPQEQSLSGCGQGGGVENQPQHRRLWRCRSSCPLLLTSTLSSSPTSLLTISPALRAFTVRGGQTRPYRPRLVVSLTRGTCPPFPPSPSPHTAFFPGPLGPPIICSGQSIHPPPPAALAPEYLQTFLLLLLRQPGVC